MHFYMPSNCYGKVLGKQNPIASVNILVEKKNGFGIFSWVGK